MGDGWVQAVRSPQFRKTASSRQAHRIHYLPLRAQVRCKQGLIFTPEHPFSLTSGRNNQCGWGSRFSCTPAAIACAESSFPQEIKHCKFYAKTVNLMPSIVSCLFNKVNSTYLVIMIECDLGGGGELSLHFHLVSDQPQRFTIVIRVNAAHKTNVLSCIHPRMHHTNITTAQTNLLETWHNLRFTPNLKTRQQPKSNQEARH